MNKNDYLKNIIIGITTFIIGSIIVGLFNIYILNKPNITLSLSTVYNSENNQTLSINAVNNNSFTNFQKDSISYALAIPLNTLKDKEIIIMTPQGSEPVKMTLLNENSEGNPTFEFKDDNGVRFTFINGTIPNFLYKKTSTNILTLRGEFNNDEVKICILYNTPFGMSPDVNINYKKYFSLNTFLGDKNQILKEFLSNTECQSAIPTTVPNGESGFI